MTAQYGQRDARVEDAFPTDCHFKIIARDEAGIRERIVEAFVAHGVDAPVTDGNRSAAGTYVTYNVTARIESLASMRAIDTAVGRIKGVRMVL
jgi:putative lipoic acid-binding regulatory protein